MSITLSYPISFIGNHTKFLSGFTDTNSSIKYMCISNFKSLSINAENLEQKCDLKRKAFITTVVCLKCTRMNHVK